MATNSSLKRPPSPIFYRIQRLLNYGDRPWRVLLIAMSTLVLVLMLGIGWTVWRDSSLSRETFGWQFIVPSAEFFWNPVSGNYQAWPFIYGTLVTSLVAIVLAVPVSVGIAIFLAELSPTWLRVPTSWMVELLAAVPSVVFGLWGIYVFLPIVVYPIGQALSIIENVPLIGLLFQGPTPESGASRLAAGIILAIMITPTITAVVRDVFLAIPANQREASLALGATQWETIWKVLIPYGMSGMLGAVILGLGRALGETMAVTMVIGNSLEGSYSLLRPGYTIASIIASQFPEASDALHVSALIEVGLVLFVITLLLNIVARLMVWQVARRTPQDAR